MKLLDFSLFVNWLGLFGIAVFALSGALDAARKEMDIIGFMLIATVTGLGGGTLRDLLLGLSPVYWVNEPIYVGVCLLAAVLTYFLAPYIRYRGRALIWMDALGLSVFCVTGTQVAYLLGVPPLIAVCMGVMTATFGGILRDVLCGVSLVLGSRELYVTCATAGSCAYMLVVWLSFSSDIGLLIGFFTALSLRSSALIFDLRLRAYPGSDE